METNQELLMQILAMFFALAGLAEPGSSLSRPLRQFLLRILRPAGLAVPEYIAAFAQFPCADAPTRPHDPLASLILAQRDFDAMRPAIRLQALMLMLATLQEQVGWIAGRLASRFGGNANARLDGEGRRSAKGWGECLPHRDLRLAARSPPPSVLAGDYSAGSMPV